MSQPRLHADQLDVSVALLRRLLASQAPAFADAELRPVRSTGTVNALFRVGDDILARLPIMAAWSDPAAETETLRFVRDRVSVRVPEVRLLGEPDAGYPQRWLLLDWIDGAVIAPGGGGAELAGDLAVFLRELWRLPTEGAREGYRVALARHDDAVRDSVAAASDLVDADLLLRLWDDALAAPDWDRPPVWTHSDLLAANVLGSPRGGLAAVLDWEAAGVGDPSCDLMAAWSMLDRGGREHLRRVLGPDPVDAGTWRRGRGWALAQAVIALPYYRESNPGLVSHSLHVLGELGRDA